jgi:hypothetical protein
VRLHVEELDPDQGKFFNSDYHVFTGRGPYMARAEALRINVCAKEDLAMTYFSYHHGSTGPPVPAGAEKRRAVIHTALLWLAACLAIDAPVPAASQSNSGSKLVGAEVIGPAEQGWSVALSADSKTAVVGGIVDKRLTGAVWVFTRRGDVWTQQSAKLVGSGAVGQAGMLRRHFSRRPHDHDRWPIRR